MVNTRLFNLYNNNLQKGVRGVFNPSDTSRKMMDYRFKFEVNASKFAAYKSNYVGNTLRNALIADEANFSKNAKRILSRFNRFQLTEYNTTVSRCRAAKQFMGFQQTQDIYPNLEWLRSRSTNKRELHIKFTGIILPINDSFWIINQPGNLYNCKCGWRRSDKPITLRPQNVATPKGLEIFAHRSRRLFSDKHPYFAKATEQKQIDEFLKNHTYSQFNKTKEGYYIHPLQDMKANDLEDLKLVATHFAKQEKAFIIPTLREHDNDLYKYLLVDYVKSPKCPDLRIGDRFMELESYTTATPSKRTLNVMINKAIVQSENIIIDIRGVCTINHATAKIIIKKKKGAIINTAFLISKEGIKKIVTTQQPTILD